MTIFPALRALSQPLSRLVLRRLPSSRHLRWLLPLMAVLITAGAEWLSPAGGGYLADEWLRDRYIRLQTTDAEEPRVLVVDIDEASLASVGAWPWGSGRIADLVEILLTDYQSRGVALDILLTKPGAAGDDLRLALLAANAPLVLAQALDYSQTRPDLLREGVLGGATHAPGPAAAATGYLANHAQLAGAARHVGNIGFIPDNDGALRRVPLLTRYNGQTYPALSLALVNCCGGGPALAPGADAAGARVSYRRDWTAYTVVSAADILQRRIDPASASGRLVLVGSSSLTLSDRVTTPLAANRPGLGVQAAMLSTLLDRRDGLTPAPWPGRWIACGWALLMASLASYTFPRLSAARNVALLAAGSGLWLLVAFGVSLHDTDFSPTAPLATLLFLLAFAVPYQWQLTQQRSRHLLDTLRQYVAPAVVAELLRSDLKDPLAPRQLDVTTLIADMEGYTTQVESLPVDEAAKLTRDFLECLTGPVIATHGTLDKYTGDGLVAFWGAPLPNLQHADLALDAAHAIVRRVQLLSQKQQARGRPPLRVRIGIDSGLAMAGDFGTAFRSIYTAVGDSVNTASRLEQAARDYPYDVIIGAGTVARARRHQFLRLGERLLRGKEKPTTLYTFEAAMTVTVPHTAPRSAPAAGVRS
ncbi:adenylate cyclase class-3/4/guanylyl cyclase [Janthinobacterium sp. HH01]|uniref:CHASE2 domain-containing protein n=1 Tax=Janthinobacterium sp. HH01 TaxID=1198452 RepID=UPI0002AECA42|nr:adenylate/guanylate cyclase domain-containing protein [Janthinobacterium sp. HH01]ELX10624.1 adenylate cyclase class-3/4/guanylyl cyclase [Janthinobacterium sp. HH01]